MPKPNAEYQRDHRQRRAVERERLIAAHKEIIRFIGTAKPKHRLVNGLDRIERLSIEALYPTLHEQLKASLEGEKHRD